VSPWWNATCTVIAARLSLPVSMVSVLIVEDLQDTSETLADYLRIAHGYDVRTASDGEKGLKLALAEPPDVVVSDIGMPGLNGIKLAHLLAEQLVPKPLLIAVTAWNGTFPREGAIEVFDHYLVKPADPVRIAELIDDFFEQDTAVDE
jgi:two-component system, OmpR family, response regulator